MRHFDASTSMLGEVGDLIPLMVSVVDRDGRYHYVNRHYADYLGMEPKDFVGRSIGVIPLDDPALDDEGRLALIRQCIDAGSEIEREVRIRRSGECRKLILKLCGDREAGMCYGFLIDAGDDPVTEALERDLLRALARRY